MLREPSPDFQGRTDEIAEFLETLQTSGLLIAGLTGEGGIGKTELAYRLAYETRDRYPDGQILVELAGVSATPTPVERAMTEVLIELCGAERSYPTDPEQLARLYQSELARRDVLLLFDNARDADQVRPLLPPQRCGVLVTSRRAFVLPGLTPKRLDELKPADAEALALKIAPTLGDRASELAAACGYRAEAVRVAASAVALPGVWTPVEYVARFQADPLSHLDAVSRAYRLSCDRLDATDRLAWAQLGVFPATFDRPAAAAVIAEGDEEAAAPTLARLIGASLVKLDSEPGRFLLHDLARQFAVGLLTGEQHFEANAAHAEHYGGVLASADEEYLQGDDGVFAGLTRFDEEQINIETAHDWAMAHDDRDDAQRLRCRLPSAGVYVLALRHHPRRRIAWLKSAVAAARQLGERAKEGTANGT